MIDNRIRRQGEDHSYAARDLVLEGEPEGALAEYERAPGVDPTFTEAMHGLAKTL